LQPAGIGWNKRFPREKGAFQPMAKQLAVGTKNPATKEEKWAWS
jgi:hypothetical protein